ncbi:MAG: Rdx family protein, partial [Acidimicrobiia bacterium]|nr:Rdx family protein [Acidimicrobiia bacterium]
HLIPSRGGVFEIVVDGRLVFSKSETNRHAEYESDVAPSLRTVP